MNPYASPLETSRPARCRRRNDVAMRFARAAALAALGFVAWAAPTLVLLGISGEPVTVRFHPWIGAFMAFAFASSELLTARRGLFRRSVVRRLLVALLAAFAALIAASFLVPPTTYSNALGRRLTPFVAVWLVAFAAGLFAARLAAVDLRRNRVRAKELLS